MRTTATLDDDVAAKLRSEARSSGTPFKQALNEALRRGLLERPPDPPGAFSARRLAIRAPRPGISLDEIGGLLDRIEGEQRR